VTVLTGRQCIDEHTVETSLGELSAPTALGPNRTEYTLRVGNVPGTATVSIPGEGSSAQVDFAAAPATSMQLHQHGPISEGDGTYSWQVAEAERWNVGVLWWTDHDYRYWHDWYESPEWVLGTPLQTEAQDSGERESWWSIETSAFASVSAQLDEESLLDDTPTLAFSSEVASDATDDWTTASIHWNSKGRRIYRPLLADVALRFSVRAPEDFDSTKHRVRVEIPLSRLDPTTVASIWFVAPDDTGLLPAGAVPIETAWIPGEWTDVVLNVSEFAAASVTGGIEHTLRGLNLHLEGTKGTSTTAHLGAISITHTHQGDELRHLQAEYLAALEGNVAHHVGQEVSYDTTDTLHFNALGSSVPWMDYGQWNLQTQASKIVEDIHAYGGIAVFNHPFGVYLGLGQLNNPGSLVQSTCEWLDREALFGVDLIEIGYPERELDLQRHLDLWDCLLDRGYTTTAIGTSDLHVSQDWSEYPNNFVTWVLAHDSSEEAYINALAGGRAFFGDPTQPFSGRPFLDLVLPDQGAMGQVIDELPDEPVEVQAIISGLDSEDQVQWIVNGALENPQTNLGKEEVLSHTVQPGTWTTVRIEVYNKAGEAKLFSNPIFLSTVEQTVPTLRRPLP
jgi:hypothetical protein